MARTVPDNVTGSLGPAHGPNCGVTAVAVVAGMPFDVVFDTFRIVRKKPRQWQGATYHQDRVAMLKHWDVPHKVTFLLYQGDSASTLSTWLSRRLPKVDRKAMMIAVTGHSFTLRWNGELADWEMVDQGCRNGWQPVKPHLLRKRVIEVIETI
jgi:hypothetical protein